MCVHNQQKRKAIMYLYKAIRSKFFLHSHSFNLDNHLCLLHSFIKILHISKNSCLNLIRHEVKVSITSDWQIHTTCQHKKRLPSQFNEKWPIEMYNNLKPRIHTYKKEQTIRKIIILRANYHIRHLLQFKWTTTSTCHKGQRTSIKSMV